MFESTTIQKSSEAVAACKAGDFAKCAALLNDCSVVTPNNQRVTWAGLYDAVNTGESQSPEDFAARLQSSIEERGRMKTSIAECDGCCDVTAEECQIAWESKPILDAIAANENARQTKYDAVRADVASGMIKTAEDAIARLEEK